MDNNTDSILSDLAPFIDFKRTRTPSSTADPLEGLHSSHDVSGFMDPTGAHNPTNGITSVGGWSMNNSIDLDKQLIKDKMFPVSCSPPTLKNLHSKDKMLPVNCSPPTLNNLHSKDKMLPVNCSPPTLNNLHSKDKMLPVNCSPPTLNNLHSKDKMLPVNCSPPTLNNLHSKDKMLPVNCSPPTLNNLHSKDMLPVDCPPPLNNRNSNERTFSVIQSLPTLNNLISKDKIVPAKHSLPVLANIDSKDITFPNNSLPPAQDNRHSSRATNQPQPGDGSPYKPQRPPAAPPSPATYPNYPPTPNSMRYAQQSPYGTAVPYRDNPYTVRTPSVVSERQQPPVEFVRNDNMAPQVRPRISLLTNMTATPEYLSAVARTRIQPGEPYRERERERTIDLVTPSTRNAEVYRERERERDRDCVVVPSSQSSIQDLGPAVKKIRLGEPKPELQQQLRIETRQDLVNPNPTPAYNPQVEAISPTLPAETVAEDVNYRSNKDDLLQQISKVDREISKTEGNLSKLKKKEQELEETACQPDEKKDEEEATAQQPKHQSLAQKIYAENRRKAQKAHAVMEKLGPKVELPLYNQPSDTAVYHENKARHLQFKKRLLIHLQAQEKEREEREKQLAEEYSLKMQEWHRKVEKIEQSAKRKVKEAKNREFFEKVFPELRKQREDRERINRIGARVKSEADLEEIMDGLQEQEMEDKKMRSYAVVPPMLLDSSQRKHSYLNKNGLIEDFATEYKERQVLNVWTKAEIEIFKDKFLQHPKNFGVIASYLDRKSACDCVQYYYHSKKEENYKRLLRKSRQRTRSSRNPHGKVNNAGGAGASTSGAPNDPMDSILSSVSGVTTRLQREQLQKQEHPPPPAPSEAPSVPPAPICDTLTVEPSADKDNNPSPPLLTVAVTPPPSSPIGPPVLAPPDVMPTATLHAPPTTKKRKYKKKKKVPESNMVLRERKPKKTRKPRVDIKFI